MSFQAVIREYDRLELGHSHAFAQAVIPLQGQMDIEIGGRFKALKVGSVGLIAPETLHDSETTSGSRFLIIDVSDKAAVSRFFRNAHDSQLDLSPLALNYLNFVASLTDTFKNDAAGASSILNTALELATGGVTEPIAAGERLHNVKAQLTARTKISELARDEGYSVSSLQKKLKASFGKSPKQLQLEMRLDKALDLLRSSNQSITAISFQIGYENASSFTNIFKKHIGLTPSQYRAQYRAPAASC